MRGENRYHLESKTFSEVENQGRNEGFSPSTPRIDLSTWPALPSAFSIAALSSSSVAVSLALLAIDCSLFLRSEGNIDGNSGKTSLKRKPSIMEREGLTAPKELKAAMAGEVLSFKEPKSCEEPLIPMLSSLGKEEHDHGGKVVRRRRRVARQTIHPDI